MLKSFIVMFVLLVLTVGMVVADTGINGTRGHYWVLTGTPNTPAPFDAVDFYYGPTEIVDGVKCFWWRMEIRKGYEWGTPILEVRALTDRDPLVEGTTPMVFKQYMLYVPDKGEYISYRNIHTGNAILPNWKDFDKYFIPHRVKGSVDQGGLPNSLTLLGSTLTLQMVFNNQNWQAWNSVNTLNLDPELLVGASRNFKDTEGTRVKRGNDYTYIPFTQADYRLMVDVGFNLFTIAPNQEQYVRKEPVFYMRGFGGVPSLTYPTDLYRSNYLGSVMFMDEPTMILTGDTQINTKLRYFSDFASVIQQRVRSVYEKQAYTQERDLIKINVNLGDMRLKQYDFPSWETASSTAFYQMEGGCNGMVNEGRYQLDGFKKDMDRWSGVQREYTPQEYLCYEYALLRGGTRPFGKFWGTAIYGQADPKITPLAVTLAYDMGARYIWFWTSDHEHHLPWNEQIALVKTLRTHVNQNPRPSILAPAPQCDLAITIPYGYFPSLSQGGSNPDATLWWIRDLDSAGQSDSSLRYNRVMVRTLNAVIGAFNNKESFDITVDDGRIITGYNRIVTVSDK